MNSEINKPSATPKASKKRFHGVVVPMVTAAGEDGRGDADAMIGLIQSCIDSGVEPFLFGTTGEASSISSEEKIRLATIFCPKFADLTTLYMGISSNCFSESVDLTKRFSDLGAHVAVANLPSYYPLGADQILSYFERLADSSALPLIIYNIPSTTRMSIPLEVVEVLGRHPNIVGLKDSERDEQRLKSAIAQYKDREDFSHFIGWAAQSTNALRWGSDGLVPSSGNIVPCMYRDLYNAVLEDDLETANRLQQETNEISKIYQENRSLGDSLAALKVLLNELGLCGTAMFPPLTAVPEEDQAAIRNQWTSFCKA